MLSMWPWNLGWSSSVEKVTSPTNVEYVMTLKSWMWFISRRVTSPTNVEYVTLKSWMRFISRIPVEERLCWDPQKGAHNNGSQINLSWLFLVSNWVDSLIGWSKWAPISSLPPHFPIPVFSVLWVGVGKKKKGKEVTETWMWKKYFAGPHTYFAKRCWRWLKWHLGIW